MQRCTKLYRINWEVWEPVLDLPKIGNTVFTRVYVWEIGYWERLEVEVRVNIKKKGTSKKKNEIGSYKVKKAPNSQKHAKTID